MIWKTSAECHHCKDWIEAGQEHDCWTTTEAALTAHLTDDLRDAWERIRETAVEFGDQRIYASGTAIMFSRTVCYFFVRPKTKSLEVCVFLGRRVKDPRIRGARPTSRTKIAHTIRVTHRDEVEAPLTDWLREAYDVSDRLRTKPATRRAASRRDRPAARAARPARRPARRRRRG